MYTIIIILIMTCIKSIFGVSYTAQNNIKKAYLTDSTYFRMTLTNRNRMKNVRKFKGLDKKVGTQATLRKNHWTVVISFYSRLYLNDVRHKKEKTKKLNFGPASFDVMEIVLLEELEEPELIERN